MNNPSAEQQAVLAAFEAMQQAMIDKDIETMTALVNGGKTKATFIIPNAKQGALSKLYAGGASIEDIDYGPEAVTVTAIVDAATRGALRDFDTCPQKTREEWEV